MKKPARNPNGSWCKAALALSDFFQCMPEELFSSEQQRFALETHRATAEMGFAEIQQLRSRSFRPDQLAEASDLRRVIHEQLQKLTEREQRVLTLRFGLNGEDEHTLEAIGQLFGVTGEEIRKIEGRALRKLKHPARSGRIRDALGAVYKRGYRYGDNCPQDNSSRFDGVVIDALGQV